MPLARRHHLTDWLRTCACACILLSLPNHLHHALAADVSATTIETTLTSTTTLSASTITVTVTLSRTSAAHSTTETGAGTTTSTGIMTSTTAAAPSMATPGSLEAVVLNSTNWWRHKYEAQPLAWNDTMADYAQKYAKGCIWKHSGGPSGENLAANFENSALAIDAWANEESKYDWGKAKFTHKTGHFTQLVWRNTTSVGCGLVACDNAASGGVKGDYLVCEYWPPGNYKGDFKNNVVKPGVNGDGSPGMGGAAGGSVSVKKAVVALVAATLVGAMFS